MPFRRRRKRRGRRRRRRRGGMSTRAVAFKALAATDQEMKFIDTNFTELVILDAIGSPATIDAVNFIAEGTTDQTRIGRRAKMISLYLQFQMDRDGADALLTTYIRLIILWDKQPNGSLPSWQNILKSQGTANTKVEMLAPNNLANSKRFDTLLDKRFVLGSNGFLEGKTWKKYMRLNRTTQYNGAGATIAQIATGSLILAFASSNVANFPTVSGTARLRFVG